MTLVNPNGAFGYAEGEWRPWKMPFIRRGDNWVEPEGVWVFKNDEWVHVWKKFVPIDDMQLNATPAGAEEGASRVELTWTAPVRADSYVAYRADGTEVGTSTDPEMVDLNPVPSVGVYSVEALDDGEVFMTSVSNSLRIAQAPTECSASRNGDDVLVSWSVDHVGMHDHIQVVRNDSSEQAWLLPFGTTSWTDTGAGVGGQVNSYKVRAIVSFIPGPYSNESSVTVPANVPVNVSAEATVVLGQLKLIWGHPEGDRSGYFYEILDKGNWSAGATVTGAPQYHTWEAGSGDRSFRVRTNSEGGDSAFITASATPLWQGAPNPPSNVVISKSGSRLLTLAWDNSVVDSEHSAADYYEVATSSNNVSWSSAGIQSSPYQHDFKTSSEGLKFMRVRAINGAGNSTWVDRSATPDWLAPPNKPTSVALVTTDTIGQLRMTWTAPEVNSTHDAATSYQVQTSDDNVTWTSVPGNQNTGYVHTFSAGSGLRYMRVRATNDAGSSGYAGTSKAPMWTAAPNVPTGLTTAATSTIGELTFTWSAPSADSKHSAATGYQVRTSTDGVNWSSAGDKNSPYTHSFGSSGSGSRYMQVKAQNSAGSSAYVEKSGSPMWIAKPNVPEDLEITATEVIGELVLSWSEPSTDDQHSAAQTYQVQTSTDNNSWTTQTGNKTSPYAYDFGTTGSGKRYIRVRATNSAGSSGYVGLGETPFWALPTPGKPTFVHLMPKTSYGKMYFKFKMPSANVAKYQTRYMIGNGAWVNGAATAATNNGSYEVNLTTLTAGQTINTQVRAGNSTGQWSAWNGTWVYATVASPIHVDPESSGHYRENMWGRSSNWTKPYQGYFNTSTATYQGYYFYGDRIRNALSQTGRTFTKAVPTFYRPQSGSAEGSCGNGQAGEAMYVGVHSQKTNPGSRNIDVPFAPITNIKVIGSPANGQSVNTESLSTAAMDALIAGTKNGIGLDSNAGGGGGRPYLCMHSFGTENTGRISFHHLG